MSPNSPRKGTSLHTYRLDDALWSRVAAKAAANNTTVSAVIRAALERYVNRPSK